MSLLGILLVTSGMLLRSHHTTAEEGHHMHQHIVAYTLLHGL
jgi:hypothetical protein